MTAQIAFNNGDGIGSDIWDSTLYLINMALRQVGVVPLGITAIDGGAAYFQETRQDMEPNGEETARTCDAIFK